MGCVAFSKQSCQYRVCLFIRSKKAQQYKMLLLLCLLLIKNLAHSSLRQNVIQSGQLLMSRIMKYFFINETKFMGTTECDKSNDTSLLNTSFSLVKTPGSWHKSLYLAVLFSCCKFNSVTCYTK